MSNRRTQQKTKKSRAKAPADASLDSGELESSAEDTAQRRVWLWSGLKIFLGGLLVLGTASAIAWGAHRYALTTPRFAIEEIVVEGTRRLSRDQILALTQIQRGDNVFSVDVDRAESLVLESPWVASVRITRRLPGQVRVELQERVPRALLVFDGQSWLVSDDARPFKLLDAGDPHDLPLITGLDLKSGALTEEHVTASLGEALGLLSAYERVTLAQAYPAEEVHLNELGHAVLTVGSQGTALHLGAAPWKQKLLRAARVLAQTQTSGGTPGVIFLDNEAHPERVVVRVK